MKKILMILDKEFPSDIRVEKEAKALISAGFDVHLACLSFHHDFNQSDEINGIKIHRKYISKFYFKTSVGCLKFPIYFHWWRKFILSILQKYKFDFIHIHDLPLAQIGYEVKQKFNIIFFLDLHENWPAFLQISKHTNTFLGKLLSSHSQWVNYEKRMVKNADHVICVVDEAKQRLSSYTENITIVSNTVELVEYQKSKFNDNLIHLTYAGGITEHRGLDTVIRALQRIQPILPNIVFDILGDGSYLEFLKQLTSELRLQKNINFYGWVDFHEAQRIVESADMAIIPHKKSEHTDSTIPHKLFQYMNQRLPILASNCEPIERIINETKSGIIYKWDSDEELSNAIITLVKSPELRFLMGENGFNAVKNKYNWNNDARKLTLLYQTLISENI